MSSGAWAASRAEAVMFANSLRKAGGQRQLLGEEFRRAADFLLDLHTHAGLGRPGRKKQTQRKMPAERCAHVCQLLLHLGALPRRWRRACRSSELMNSSAGARAPLCNTDLTKTAARTSSGFNAGTRIATKLCLSCRRRSSPRPQPGAKVP